MRTLSFRLAIAAAMLTTTLSTSSVLAQSIPTPKSVLGQDVGSDRYLANYDDSVRYFQKLAESSDRIKLFTAGKSTQGRDIIYSVISSPENIANFEKYKDISRRLGKAEGLTDDQAKQLARDSKIIIHIDGGLHSTEVADHQLPIALAHKLLSAKGDAEIDEIMKDVILVLWPTLNPDGQNMVVDWYRKHLGTPYETTKMPWLYQEYVGHDNNRDGYMNNMIESQVATRMQQDYAPVVWYTQHQTAPVPARIWMPPFADPVSSNISPYVRIWTSAIGTNMMARFEKEQKPGAIAQATFDNWYPGYVDYTHVFRNTISFFTEVAHDSATPKFYKVEDFPKHFQDTKALIMYPSPWKGGWWRLKDSVDYMVTASMSVLETAVKYRETMLYNRYQAARDTINLYAKEGPFAYVIPSGQTDMPEAALLAQKMIDHGLKVHQAKAAITLGGVNYPAGSWVLLMDQPYAALAKELFETQKFPDALLTGAGTPARLPYDVTGWTLPMQMGVTVEPVKAPVDAGLRQKLTPLDKVTIAGGRITGTGNVFALSRKTNASFLAMNDVLAKGGRVGFSNAAVMTVNGSEPDAIIVEGISRADMQSILQKREIDARAVAKAPATTGMTKSRVAVYRPWGHNQYDEGWTRWLLEQYEFGAGIVYNADVKAGDLGAKYDTIVIPDLAGTRPLSKPDREAQIKATGITPPEPRKGPVGILLDGLSPLEAPAPYAGGVGDDGGAALRKFVSEGGTVVAMNSAADAIVDLFDLPVTNIVKDADSKEFFCSGALLQVTLNGAASATAGMPNNPIVMFENSPVFVPKPGFQGKILASYAPDQNPLRSGVLIGPEKIQGKAAAVEVSYGKGKVYLYGFRPQWRAQSHGTYKFLFNPLYKTTGGQAH